MKIVTAHQMHALDRRTIQEAGVPGHVLMERAGAGVVAAMEETFGPMKGKTVTIFCGKGNNGGDGFVVARLLRRQRVNVQVCLLARAGDLKGDAKLMYQRVAKSAGGAHIARAPSPDRMRHLTRQSHVLVDALLGTGTSAPVTGPYAEAIHAMNASELPTVAMDLPSGIHADTGEMLGTAVHASLTVTFGNPKLGLFLGSGIDHAGRVRHVDIGIPDQYVEAMRIPIELLTPAAIRSWLPTRRASSHKGTFGHVGLIAGSPGQSGAAVLAANAALRSGAGLVTVAAPASVQAHLESRVMEVMTLPLPETKDHMLARRALPQLLAFVQSRSAIGMGPGLSTHVETAEVIRTLIAQCDRPTVIDADALNALAGHTHILRACPMPTILTPHPGEMARLLNTTTDMVTRNRLGTAQEFARAHSVIMVLKGARTIIAHPHGHTAISPTGNPGMATAGTGDVLTGVIAGLLAQGLAPWEAAQSGVYLHGLAGDLAAETFGHAGLLAGDLLQYLPRAIMHVLHAGDRAPISVGTDGQ